MQLEDWLKLVPANEIPGLLREGEEAILNQVQGDIFALQTCLRLMCRFVHRHRKMPRFRDMPPEVQGAALYLSRKRKARARAVRPEQFAVMSERLEVLAHEIGGRNIKLKPVRKVIFEDDPDLERDRRVQLYARQWEAIEEMYDENALMRQGPAATPVWCEELAMEFPSARQAAAYLREVLGREKIRRSDIRTAIRRGCRCAGMRWRYVDGGDKKIIRNGCERLVHCVDLAISFPSLSEAAAFAGTSTSTMSALLNAGECELDGHLYQWGELPPAAAVAMRDEIENYPLFAHRLAPVEEDRSFAEKFPLFALV